MTTKSKKSVRISANLPQEDFDLLKELADALNITMTDVLRRGIQNEQFFRSIKEEGSRLMVRTRGGSLNTVIQRCDA